MRRFTCSQHLLPERLISKRKNLLEKITRLTARLKDMLAVEREKKTGLTFPGKAARITRFCGVVFQF